MGLRSPSIRTGDNGRHGDALVDMTRSQGNLQLGDEWATTVMRASFGGIGWILPMNW
jgi:hypothetical protein